MGPSGKDLNGGFTEAIAADSRFQITSATQECLTTQRRVRECQAAIKTIGRAHPKVNPRFQSDKTEITARLHVAMIWAAADTRVGMGVITIGSHSEHGRIVRAS